MKWCRMYLSRKRHALSPSLEIHVPNFNHLKGTNVENLSIKERNFRTCAYRPGMVLFSDPNNLKKITPAYLRFKVLECPETNTLCDDMLIKYKITPLLRIPIRWVKVIEAVAPMASFIDKQLSGPYRLWEHKHSFSSREGGTLMVDEVRDALPLGVWGTLAHGSFVVK